MKYKDFICNKSNWNDRVDYTFMQKDGIAIGTLTIYKNGGKEGVINGLNVDKTRRNEGVGSMLLLILEDLARCANKTYVYLAIEAVYAIKTKNLISFYKKRGYEYYKDLNEDSLIHLRKKL